MAEIGFGVWGTRANFNGFRVLSALLHGTLVLGVMQRSFAALNRGCHLYSAGRPLRLALAHILVLFSFADLTQFGVTPEDKAVKQKPTVLVTTKELTC